MNYLKFYNSLTDIDQGYGSLTTSSLVYGCLIYPTKVQLAFSFDHTKKTKVIKYR